MLRYFRKEILDFWISRKINCDRICTYYDDDTSKLLTYCVTLIRSNLVLIMGG